MKTSKKNRFFVAGPGHYWNITKYVKFDGRYVVLILWDGEPKVYDIKEKGSVYTYDDIIRYLDCGSWQEVNEAELALLVG